MSQVDFGSVLIHNHTMKRRVRIALWVYLAGALATEMLGLWGAYDSGGFDRDHTLRDLVMIGSIHLLVALLLPVVLVILALQYLGFLPHPITF